MSNMQEMGCDSLTMTTNFKVCGNSTTDNPWNTGHCLKHWKELLTRFKEGGGTVVEFTSGDRGN